MIDMIDVIDVYVDFRFMCICMQNGMTEIQAGEEKIFVPAVGSVKPNIIKI